MSVKSNLAHIESHLAVKNGLDSLTFVGTSCLAWQLIFERVITDGVKNARQCDGGELARLFTANSRLFKKSAVISHILTVIFV